MLYMATKLKDAPVAPVPAFPRTLCIESVLSDVDSLRITNMLRGLENVVHFPFGFINLHKQIVQNNDKQTKGIFKGLSPIGAYDKALKIPLQRNGRAEDYHIGLIRFTIAGSRLLPSQEDPGP